MKPRIVLDTNVLVSALLGGACSEVIHRWRAGELDIVLSAEIMAEYEQVLARPKFGLPGWMVQELLGFIRERAQWVTPAGEERIAIRDTADAKFLEAATAGKAAWIVSGDQDLLALGEYKSIPIITPGQLLIRLRREAR